LVFKEGIWEESSKKDDKIEKLELEDFKTSNSKSISTLDNKKYGYSVSDFSINSEIKKIHKSFSANYDNRTGSMISSYSEIIQGRMKGEIRSGLISPVVSQSISSTFQAIEDRLINKFAIGKIPEIIQKELEKQSNQTSGVSAGDGMDEDENLKNKKKLEASVFGNLQENDDQKKSTHNASNLQRIINLSILSAGTVPNKFTVDGGEQIEGVTIDTSNKIVPIFDIKNNPQKPVSNFGGISYIFSELFGIQTTQANPAIAIGAGELLMYGSGVLLGSIAGNKALEDYQLFSNYSKGDTIYAPEGSYRPALTNNPMLSGNTGLFVNPIDQMKFDGVMDDKSGVINTSNDYLIKQGFDVNNLRSIKWDDKISTGIFSTPDQQDKHRKLGTLPGFPIIEPKVPVYITPDDRENIQKRGILPGFIPTNSVIPSIFSTPILNFGWKDLVVFQDGDDSPQSRKCEKPESKIWQEFDSYKVINGMQTKTNNLKGKDRRYYQWDNLHKEIEVYDHKFRPLEVLDPVKGEKIPKSVKSHKDIKW
jgi:hypothetical protein